MSDVTATDFPLSSGHGRPAVCLWATSRRCRLSSVWCSAGGVSPSAENSRHNARDSSNRVLRRKPIELYRPDCSNQLVKKKGWKETGKIPEIPGQI